MSHPYRGFVRITSWNVLADAYVRPDWFPQADPAVLVPGARRKPIARLIDESLSDVVALQEAEADLLDELSKRWVVLRAPKGRSKPDGCALLVADGWRVLEHLVHHYRDGSGHVAQVAHLLSPAGQSLVVANTYLRWSPAPDSTGLKQVTEMLALLPAVGPVVVCADLNALPGDPVRTVLHEAGLIGALDEAPTSIFNGNEPRALDVVAGRDILRGRHIKGLTDAWPSWHMPSDHAMVIADIVLNKG